MEPVTNEVTEVATPVVVTEAPVTEVATPVVVTEAPVIASEPVSQPETVAVASKPKRTRKPKVEAKPVKAKRTPKVEVKVGRGRPIVFKGKEKRHIVSVIRKHGLTKGREVLAGEKISISLPTLGKFAAEAGIELHRGRPAA
jgi:hypothetical protein